MLSGAISPLPLRLHEVNRDVECRAVHVTKRKASDSKATERLAKQIIYSRSCVIKRKHTEFIFKKKKLTPKPSERPPQLRVEQALCVWDKWELIRQLPVRPLYDFSACLYRDSFCSNCYLYVIYYNTLQVHGNFST